MTKDKEQVSSWQMIGVIFALLGFASWNYISKHSDWVYVDVIIYIVSGIGFLLMFFFFWILASELIKFKFSMKHLSLFVVLGLISSGYIYYQWLSGDMSLTYRQIGIALIIGCIQGLFGRISNSSYEKFEQSETFKNYEKSTIAKDERSDAVKAIVENLKKQNTEFGDLLAEFIISNELIETNSYEKLNEQLLERIETYPKEMAHVLKQLPYDKTSIEIWGTMYSIHSSFEIYPLMQAYFIENGKKIIQKYLDFPNNFDQCLTIFGDNEWDMVANMGDFEDEVLEKEMRDLLKEYSLSDDPYIATKVAWLYAHFALETTKEDLEFLHDLSQKYDHWRLRSILHEMAKEFPEFAFELSSEDAELCSDEKLLLFRKWLVSCESMVN